MAVSTYTTNLTALMTGTGHASSCTALGGGASGLNDETDYFIQGTECVSKNAFASAKKGFIFDTGSDRAATVGTDGAFLFWVTHATPNSVDTIANGGIDAIIGNSTSAYKHYYVGGGDTIEFMGWVIAAVNPSETISEADTGSPSAVEQYIGILWDLPSGGPTKGAPNALDGIRVGRCDLIYELGTSTDPDASFDLAVADKGDVTDRLGLIQERDGSFFFSGLHQLGDNASDVVNFTDSNKTCFWNDHWKVTAPFNTLEIQNASSVVSMTSITWKAQGVNSPGRWLTTQDATVTLTNCAFIDWGTFTFDSNTTVSGCTFNGCGSVTPDDADMTGSSIISAKVRKLIDAQDETSYDNSPTTEGTFAAGSGYAVNDVITLENGSLVTVDAVSTGAVTQFTVSSTKGVGVEPSVAIAQTFCSGAGTGFTLTPDPDNLSDSSALIWNVDLDPDGNLDNMTFEMGFASHAIEFGTAISSGVSWTLRGCTFTGYNASDDQDDSTFHFLDTTGTFTLNLVNCTGNFSYRTEGVTVSIVVNPVTTKITVQDATGTAIQNARVFLETSDNGGGSGLPYQAGVSTLTQSAGTATLTASAVHGLATNDYVVIRGANIEGYNKVAQITVTSTTVFTYAVDSGLGSPAGGTPVFSYVPATGLTNASGVVQGSKTWPAAQGVEGWVRAENDASPYYQDAEIDIADASGGTDLLLTLSEDE